MHGLLVNAPEAMKAGVPAGVKAMVAGAAPPASMIEGMEKMGFDLTHVYGLTEVYGPATVCAKHEAWDALDIGDRGAAKLHHDNCHRLFVHLPRCRERTSFLLPAPAGRGN